MPSFSITKEICFPCFFTVLPLKLLEQLSTFSTTSTHFKIFFGRYLLRLHLDLRKSPQHLKLLVMWSYQPSLQSILRLPHCISSPLSSSPHHWLLYWCCSLTSSRCVAYGPISRYLLQYFLFNCTSFICTFIRCKFTVVLYFFLYLSELCFPCYFYIRCAKVLLFILYISKEPVPSDDSTRVRVAFGIIYPQVYLTVHSKSIMPRLRVSRKSCRSWTPCFVES